MKRILFIHNVPARFVRLDEDILRVRYEVNTVYIQKQRLNLLYQMWRQTRHIDVVVAWFASWHSLPGFLAAWLRGIPRVLITGGYDVANEPEIGYGLRQGGLPRIISGLVFRLSTRVLPFSSYSYQEALDNTPVNERQLVLVPLGVPDTPAFHQPVPKENLVITISTIDAVSVSRKGIRTFLETAHLLPAIPFLVVGKARDNTIDELRSIAPPNVQFTGFLPDDELVALQQRAKVYVQVSHHEGFGLAVAESMLARCIPVVTRRGSLPEVVGEHGIFVNDTRPETVAQAIEIALQRDTSAGEAAREHILNHYPFYNRVRALQQEIESVLAERST